MWALYALVRLSCVSLYGCYMTFKAAKANDLPAMERWLMFWVIMGLMSIVEGTVEWTVTWLPFYYEIKALVLLWLTLPQIEGSTYVYLTWLHPFLLKHEHEIDAGVANARAKARAAGLGYLRRLAASAREAILGAAMSSESLAPGQQQPPVVAAPATTAPPPSISDPLSGPWSLASGLVRQYGPAAIAAGSALLHPMQGRAMSPREQSIASFPSPHAGGPTTARKSIPDSLHPGSAMTTGMAQNRTVSYSRAEARLRREQLERELAELAAYGSSPSGSANSDRSVSPGAAAGGGALAYSYVGGQPFEEVRRDDAVIRPPSKPPTPQPPKAGGAWFWGRSPEKPRNKSD